MRTRTGLSAVLTALAVSCAPTALAQAPAQPANDHYLNSIPLNEPGRKLERRETLAAVTDTTNATVQGDLFNPPRSGGPAEPTSCGNASIGKTIWYDFYPDVQGRVRIRASGFDTFIAMMAFNPSTTFPDLDPRFCFNESTSTSEEAFFDVRKGDAYTVQVGGVNAAGGNLEFLFDFLADTDGDGVFDDIDRCPRLAGSARGGCPPRLRADSTLRAQPTAGGIEVLALSVTAPRRSRVAVSCSRGCSREVKRARSTVNFRRIRASGFDTFVAMMPFNRRTFVPDLNRRLCFNTSASTSEEVFFDVAKGGSYTVQVGGVNAAGGNLEFLFDFLADTDGDGVFDDIDRCPRLAGSARGGCPPRLRADSTLRAQPTAGGIEVLALSVTAPRRSRVAVSCSRGCSREVKRARSTVNFRRIRGSNLSAGSRIVIRVTRRRSIGSYIAYRIQRGNFKKIERCLNPGSRKPRKRCG